MTSLYVSYFIFWLPTQKYFSDNFNIIITILYVYTYYYKKNIGGYKQIMKWELSEWMGCV